MKLKDIASLNLSPDTQKNINIDVTAAIVSDEFNRTNSNSNYRINTINRLIKNKLPINNNNNINSELVERFISVNCPYCGHKMKSDGSSGSSAHTVVMFICRCGTQSYLTLLNSTGLCFNPPS